MIKLIDIDETNWIHVSKLEVKEEQKKYVGRPIGILARAYAYRNSRAKAQFIQANNQIIGLVMTRDMDEEPSCYELQQLLIDKNHQGKGYGKAALKVILDQCKQERKYDNVQLCVDQEDIVAINVYIALGFVDSGYIDPELPNCLNMIYKL